MERGRSWVPPAAVVAVALLLALGVGPVHGAPSGTGGGTFKVKPFAEVETTDGAIAPLSTTPTSGDPGPRVWNDGDHLRFNGGYTNARHVVFLEVAEATGSSGAETAVVQGTTHSIADWARARTDQTTRYATIRATGTSDPDAGAYTPPVGFTQDAQGTVEVRTYDRTAPEDGGTPLTIAWVYDSSQGRYWFDAVDKDFTNGNGEARVWPASTKAQGSYVFQAGGIHWAVIGTAGAGAGFVPTIAQAWDKQPGKGNGEDFDAFLLLDFPAGTPTDAFRVTLRATIQTTK